jgi:mono/diheme cytochrome c family protein
MEATNMYYALPLKYEQDRQWVGSDVLVLNIDPPNVWAILRQKPRLVARLGDKGETMFEMYYAENRIGQLVGLALAKLRDAEYRDRAAQLYAERFARCARCHRRLTAMQSVRAGLGPECQKKGGRVL